MKYHIKSTGRLLFMARFFLFIIIFNLVLNTVTGAELRSNDSPPIDGWLSSEFELDRSEIPKNILLGVNIGGWSHYRYLLPIANILADRGYNITLAARENFPESSQYPKIKFYSLGNMLSMKDKKFREAISRKLDPTKFATIVELINDQYPEMLLKFKEISEIVKADLFFCDAFVNDICFDVAWLMKKPSVAISPSILETTHIPYKSDPIFGCKVNMENEPFWERFRCEILTPFISVKTVFGFSNEYNEKRASFGLPPYKTQFERLKNTLYLVDTFFGLETPMPLPPLIQEIGPVLPDYFPPLTPNFEEFLVSHERTMFVALGSILYLSPEQFTILLQSIIESVENNIIDGVIWGNIKKFQDDFPPTITLSNGKIVSTSDIFNNKNPNIYMTSFAPQLSILNNTNTKIFLSHAGPGSLHETLFTGTPILTLPINFDQHGFADRVVSAGVALQLDRFTLNANDILNKIERILKDEQIQINTKKLKALATINSKRKYRAADLIEYILHSSIMKQKDVDDKDGIEKRIFKDWITPDTRMGFIKGNYLDVYAAALVIVVSILIGTLFTLSRIGKLIFNYLFDLDKAKKE